MKMDAVTSLLTRRSAQKLSDPAPSEADLATLMAAATNAPDHGKLKPWRFKILVGEGRDLLANLLRQSLRHRQPDAAAELLASEHAKAFRAPMIIAVAAHITPIAKVPKLEQIIAAGCAAHAMLLAAHALGYGGQWKTGPAAQDAAVKIGLGFDATDEIVGFIYLGRVDA